MSCAPSFDGPRSLNFYIFQAIRIAPLCAHPVLRACFSPSIAVSSNPLASEKMSPLRTLVARAKALHAIRFLVVGTVNTGFSYAIYAAVIFIGLSYPLANLIALAAGILFSFKTQGHLVFGNPDNRLLGRFIVSWALIYMCTIGLIGRIIAVGFDPYTAGLLALPFSVALSYPLQKYFVFRPANGRR